MRDDHFTNTPEAAARYDRDTFADLYDEAPERIDGPPPAHLCSDTCREMCASFDRVARRDEAGGGMSDEKVYGMCLGCRSVEVELVEQTGTRDLSYMGEHSAYPVGPACEVCW